MHSFLGYGILVPITPQQKAFAIAALRRASYRWPPRYRAHKAAHVGRDKYYCKLCGRTVKKRESQMDHVLPIVDPLLGWQGFDDYIERLLALDDGWQRICKPCHQIKTRKENKVRTITRRVSKKKGKKS